MKLLITSFAFIFCFYFSAIAQNDFLVVKLKNNQIDTIAISQMQRIQFENILTVNESPSANTNLRVDGNFPNPFSEQTSLEFEIAYSGSVEIIIYDYSGKYIQTLKCADCHAGTNSLQWNCVDTNNNSVQSGLYYYEVKFGNTVQSKKMVVVK